VNIKTLKILSNLNEKDIEDLHSTIHLLEEDNKPSINYYINGVLEKRLPIAYTPYGTAGEI